MLNIIRSNNPLAMRYNAANKWQGQTGESKGFAVFSNPIFGVRAGMVNLKNGYLSKGFNTLSKLFNRYAPTSDGNNPAKYAERVLKFLNDPANTPDLLRGQKIDSVNTIIQNTPENIYNITFALETIETGNKFKDYYKKGVVWSYAYNYFTSGKAPQTEQGNDFLYVITNGVKSSNLKAEGFLNPESKKKVNLLIVFALVVAISLTLFLITKKNK